MLTAVKGYYEGGKVFFKEEPPITERTEVIVTFLTDDRQVELKKRVLGRLEGKGRENCRTILTSLWMN